MNPSLWKDRSVFITGHTGFKGGWLSLWLNFLGAQVTGYAKDPETNPSFFNLTQLASRVRDHRGNLSEAQKLAEALVQAKPEVVFHMAAQPLVRRSYREPVQTYLDNVMGTIYLLEAVRHAPSVKAVVVITTDKCYENREWLWPYREDEALGGFDPYSSSKACAEIATAAWRRSFLEKSNVLVATVRAGNVIGGGDWSEDRLIPDAIRAVHSRQSLVIRHPEAVRPWQHVLDPLRGYIMTAERLLAGDKSTATAFNFGPSDEDSQPVKNVLNHFKSHFGPEFSWKVESESAQGLHEAHLLKLDSSRAKKILGWAPRWRISDSIAQTASWYKAAAEGQDMYTFSLKQIEGFCD